MNKPTTKKRNRYSHVAISAVAVHFGVTKAYVRQILRGDRTPAKLEEKVKSLYKAKQKEIDKIINN